MAPTADDLGDFWQGILDGRVVYYCEGAGPRGRYVVCRVLDGARLGGALSRLETAVLVRVLGGEQQKSIALELGIACSTASKWYTQAREKLQLGPRPVPLPLVIAAQSWALGAMPPVAARKATIFHEGGQFVVLTIPSAEPRERNAPHARRARRRGGDHRGTIAGRHRNPEVDLAADRRLPAPRDLLEAGPARPLRADQARAAGGLVPLKETRGTVRRFRASPARCHSALAL